MLKMRLLVQANELFKTSFSDLFIAFYLHLFGGGGGDRLLLGTNICCRTCMRVWLLSLIMSMSKLLGVKCSPRKRFVSLEA